MCCMMPRVQRVSDTNLFARLSGHGTQFLVYQMRYQAKEPIAMILPIPVALPVREKAVRFIDLSGYPTFFADLRKAFPAQMTWGRGGFASKLRLPKADLPVESVGDFEASFVPSQEDFERVDPRFRISKSAFQKLPQYRDYGFLVFQLKETHGSPHPIAFEFATRATDRLFFPTIHIHDGLVHPRERFDHTLYFQGAKEGHSSASVASDSLAIAKTKGIVRGDSRLQIHFAQGYMINKDYWWKAG